LVGERSPHFQLEGNSSGSLEDSRGVGKGGGVAKSEGERIVVSAGGHHQSQQGGVAKGKHRAVGVFFGFVKGLR